MALRAKQHADGPTLTVLSDGDCWEAVLDGAVVTWGQERHAVVAEATHYAQRVGADLVVVEPTQDEARDCRRLSRTCYGN
jgi:hypothetical protein